MPKLRPRAFIVFFMLAGCVGFQRDCASCMASDVSGADWLILQYGFDGKPINCWKLRKTGISNEAHSDGIFWQDNEARHLVHISGWYNRVQVENGDFTGAARSIGIDLEKCQSGKYGGISPGP